MNLKIWGKYFDNRSHEIYLGIHLKPTNNQSFIKQKGSNETV